MEYSFDQKIGQIVMVGFRGTNVNADSAIIKNIRDFHLGNVWLTDSDQNYGNIKSPDQLRNLIKKIKRFAGMPLFVFIDAEGGQVIRLKQSYGFPGTYSARTVGQKDDIEFTHSESTKIARTLHDLGINLNLSPVVDLNLNPLNPSLAVKERCFSDDPNKVYRHARKTIEAHHRLGILCCLKHFPGHGSTTEDSHTGFVDASETWNRIELEPYARLIKDNLVDTILSAHIVIKHLDDTYPATLSKNIIEGLLRSEMGYDGVVISDDLNMGAIQKNYSQMEAIELAINAGVDILLYSNMPNYDENLTVKIMKSIKALVDEGRISHERIDQSFRRILKLKQNHS